MESTFALLCETENTVVCMQTGNKEHIENIYKPLKLTADKVGINIIVGEIPNDIDPEELIRNTTKTSKIFSVQR